MTSSILNPTLPLWQGVKKTEKAKPQATRSRLNKSATSARESQLTIAGEGTLLPVVYGRCSVGGKICTIVMDGNNLLMLVAFTGHPVRSFERLIVGGEIYTGQVNYYTGNQTVRDPWMAQAKTGYNDILPDVTYAVLRIAPNSVKSLDVRAVINGYKAGANLAEDKNPARVMAHFAQTYGQLKAEPTSLAKAIAHCDQVLANGQPRRQVNLVMERQQSVTNWLDVLAEYAGCWYTIRFNQLVLFPREPATEIIDVHEEKVIYDNGNHLSRPRLRDLPNQIIVEYTIPSDDEKPWQTGQVKTPYPQGEDLRFSVVQLPGIHSKSQAMRQAIERLNALNLNDLSASVLVDDNGTEIPVGSVIRLTQIYGLDEKLMRVIGRSEQGIGRWRLDCIEYDPLMFSDKIETEASLPDTNLPDPLNLPPVTSLNVLEKVKRVQTGVYPSYLEIEWDALNSIFAKFYEIQVVDEETSTVVFNNTISQTKIHSSHVVEEKWYTVQVRVISSFSIAGQWATARIYTDGKTAPPSDVPSISGYEVGGEAHIAWAAAADLDLKQYLLRYMPVGEAWDSPLARDLNLVDTLRFTTKAIPAGTWDIAIKARDSVGNFSVNDARFTLTVTLDTAAYLADEHDFIDSNLTNMIVTTRVFGDTTLDYWSGHVDDSFNTMFTSAINTYDKPIASYHRDLDAEYLSEVWDLGDEITGDWQADISGRSLKGNAQKYIELSEDGITWTAHPERAKANARYVRLRIASLSGSAVWITKPRLHAKVSATPRLEEAFATSSATAGVTITLKDKYVAVEQIDIKPRNNPNLRGVVDNIKVGKNKTNSFDVYIFDENNNRVTADFRYRFLGI